MKSKTTITYLKDVFIISCFVSVLFFFNPLNIVLENTYDLLFSRFHILLSLFIVSFLTIILLSIFIFLIRKCVVSSFIVSLTCGLLFLFFIQSLFFNNALPPLDGNIPDWGSMKFSFIVNTIVWIFILCLFLLLPILFKNDYRKILLIVSLSIFTSQAISTIPLYINAKNSVGTLYYTLDGNNQYKVSTSKNIIVFSLDNFSIGNFKQLSKSNPEVLNYFKDFTCYDNTCGNYDRTFPSLHSLLTYHPYTNFNVDYFDFIKSAWNSSTAENIYSILHRNNYKANIYSTDIVRDAVFLKDKVDNVTLSKLCLPSPDFLMQLFRISCYRLFPLCLKPYIIGSTINDVLTTESLSNNVKRLYQSDEGDFVDNPASYIYSDSRFLKGLKENGLTTFEGYNNFSWYHLIGSHPPYTTDEKCELCSDSNIERQTIGYLFSVNCFLQQMITNNTYDDALIIVTADHGEKMPNSLFPALLIKYPKQIQKQMSYDSVPISQWNIIPTILSTVDTTSKEFENTISSVNDHPYPERKYTSIGRKKSYFFTGDEFVLQRKLLNQ